jgi:allophanate hydrolase subunit 2
VNGETTLPALYQQAKYQQTKIKTETKTETRQKITHSMTSPTSLREHYFTSRAPLINAEEAAAFRKMAVQGATLKAWRVTSKSSNTEMSFSRKPLFIGSEGRGL